MKYKISNAYAVINGEEIQVGELCICQSCRSEMDKGAGVNGI